MRAPIRTEYGYRIVYTQKQQENISGRFIDMTVTVKPGNQDAMYSWFKINLARDGEHFTSIRYKPSTGIVRIDRTKSGLPCDIVNVREFPVFSNHGEIKLRIIMDRYSVELFVNGGEQAASSIIYTPIEAKSISFSTEGVVLVDVEKYDLEINKQ